MDLVMPSFAKSHTQSTDILR